MTFTDDDLDMVSGFANQASLALELTDARAEQQRVAVADDRDRIADLHDHVIQRLFAGGLSLQSVANQLGTGNPASERIAENIIRQAGSPRGRRTALPGPTSRRGDPRPADGRIAAAQDPQDGGSGRSAVVRKPEQHHARCRGHRWYHRSRSETVMDAVPASGGGPAGHRSGAAPDRARWRKRLIMWTRSDTAIDAATAPAAVHETHIGIVLLIGERAYKLKEPLRTAFLDFSTHALRQAACLREVELNRRLAPDVKSEGRRTAAAGRRRHRGRTRLRDSAPWPSAVTVPTSWPFDASLQLAASVWRASPAAERPVP